MNGSVSQNVLSSTIFKVYIPCGDIATVIWHNSTSNDPFFKQHFNSHVKNFNIQSIKGLGIAQHGPTAFEIHKRSTWVFYVGLSMERK